MSSISSHSPKLGPSCMISVPSAALTRIIWPLGEDLRSLKLGSEPITVATATTSAISPKKLVAAPILTMRQNQRRAPLLGAAVPPLSFTAMPDWPLCSLLRAASRVGGKAPLYMVFGFRYAEYRVDPASPS